MRLVRTVHPRSFILCSVATILITSCIAPSPQPTDLAVATDPEQMNQALNCLVVEIDATSCSAPARGKPSIAPPAIETAAGETTSDQTGIRGGPLAGLVERVASAAAAAAPADLLTNGNFSKGVAGWTVVC